MAVEGVRVMTPVEQETKRQAIERAIWSVERELEELIELHMFATVKEICTKALQECEARK